jgi:hypothetical protein
MMGGFKLIGATVTVINNSNASYTITSPSLNYYVVTITGGENDYAVIQSYGAIDTALMDKSTFTNP